MIVEVRPISNRMPDWMSHMKPEQSITRPITIEANVDVKNGKYETGLSEEEQEKYGKLIGADLDNRLRYEGGSIAPHPFYHSRLGRVKLENRTMIFDTSSPMDYVKIALMKASKSVANSLAEVETMATATHYIFSEEEEVKKMASKIAIRDKCIIEAAKLTPVEKMNLIIVLGGRFVTNRSNDFIEVEINNLIDKNPVEFLRVNGMDKKELNVRATVLEALRRNILTQDGFAISYMGNIVANDVDSMVKWFENPDNQKLKIAILEKLK